MPPKKAGGASKGKGKKKNKFMAKMDMIQAEGPDGKSSSVTLFRRDELEWACARLDEQLILDKSARIRYQLERDFLFELAQQYKKKLECLQLEQELLNAQNDKAIEDTENLELIKRMEGKHFRAETQMVGTQQEVRDEIRKKKIKNILERSFHTMSVEMDEQDVILERNAADYKKRTQDTQKKLQDLHVYMADHEKQRMEFVQNLEREQKNSKKLFFVIHRMEVQLSEEHCNEFIWKLSENFENSMTAMKNFYNDASFSNFTLICNLQDKIRASIQRMEQYSRKIRELQHMMKDAQEQMPTLRLQFGKVRVRHNRIVRTKAGIKTVSKELQLTQNKMNALRGEYRNNFVRLEQIIKERTNFRTNGAEMVQNVLDAYTNRFRVKEEESKLQVEVDKRDSQKNKLMANFPNFAQFSAAVTPFKNAMQDRNSLVENYQLMGLKVRKQTENLRNSLDARLNRIGLTRKHPTYGPKVNPPLGPRSAPGGAIHFGSRANWGPANLVAGSAFSKRKADQHPIDWSNPERIDTAVPACLTPSLQDFLSWRKMQREQRSFQKSKMLEVQPRRVAPDYC